MMESGFYYFNNGNFREYSYLAGGIFAVLKREFPVALAAVTFILQVIYVAYTRNQ